MSKTLVAYFSHSGDTYSVGVVKDGNTKLIANIIAQALNADTFHIESDIKYPPKYMDIIKQANKEKEANIRPKLTRELPNFSDYDTIFIGYPIWYGIWPMAVYSFLEKYDFSGKTIIPFNTHEGSGNAGTFQEMKNIMKKSTVETKGFTIYGKEARKETANEKVLKWLKEIRKI